MEYAPDHEEPLQRVNPSVNAPQPSQEKTSANNENFVTQLTEKIRKQANILQEQENYKMLCEKRILELCPNHPLPIQPSHLGKCTYINHKINSSNTISCSTDWAIC